MKPIDTLKLRAIEVRARLAEIATADMTDESRAELDTLKVEYRDNEAKQAALMIADDTPETIVKQTDGSGGAFAELRESLDFGKYVAAALSGNGVSTGAEAEYNAERGIAANFFPLDLLGRGIEKRAAISGDAQENQGTWIDQVFFGTAADHIGVSFRSVAPGIAAFPLTTSGPTSAQRGRTEAAAAGTLAVTVTEMKPARRAAHALYSIEDVMRLPGLSDAIERDMRAQLMEAVDIAIFNSDAGANENVADITGFRTGGISETTLTQANKVKADEVLKAVLAQVDGKYAASLADMRLVTSVGANTLFYGTIHNSAVDNETIAQFLMRSGMTWVTRGGIDTNTANGDFGMYMGRNRGIDGAAIAAVWEQAQMITDPYSGANKGEVGLTLNYLWNFAIPRTANFKRLKFVS